MKSRSVFSEIAQMHTDEKGAKCYKTVLYVIFFLKTKYQKEQ